MKNEYAESYVYEVLKRIPKKMRKSAKVEIEQKIAEMSGNDERNVMDVLTKLGDPAEYAKRYNKNNSKIIGSAYLETYLAVLKPTITCFAIVAALLAVFKASAGFNIDEYLQTNSYVDYAISFSVLLFEYVLSACFFSAIVVTVIFAFLQQRKNKKMRQGGWNPESLKPLKNAKKKVDIGRCLTEMVVSSVLVGALLLWPKLFGVYATDSSNTVHFVSLLNQDARNSIILLALGILLAVFVRNIVELISGIYTKKVIFFSILFGLIGLGLAVFLIWQVPFLNYEFPKELLSVKPELDKDGYESFANFYREVLPWILIGCSGLQFFVEQIPRLKKSMSSN